MANALTIEQINQRNKHTLIDNLGICFTQLSEIAVEATMPVDHRTIQLFDVLHGGASIALAETVAGVGTLNLVLPHARCVGMQISASHISSAHNGDTVLAKGTIIHKGKSTHIWNIDIYSQTTGRLISSIRVTNAVIAQEMNVAQ